MASEIRVNRITNRSGLSTASWNDHGVDITGIVTASTFKGNLTGNLTGNVTGNVTGTASELATNATGANLTLSGNLGVAGTLTYEDVARVDAVGLSTFREGFGVGPLAGIALTAYKDGSIRTSGIVTATNISAASSVTATTYYGSGAQLTGIEGGVSSDAQKNTVGGTNAGDSFSGTSAEENTLIGYDAGTDIDSGDANTVLGAYAGKDINSGHSNTFIGRRAGHQNTSGQESVAVGAYSLAEVTTASHNTSIGNMALRFCGSGQYNSCSGQSAGYNITSGNDNVCIGHGSGNSTNWSNSTSLTTGSNNILIGKFAQPSANNISNEITLGNSSITKFRIPGINFELGDNGGTPSNGTVLTMASGGATWAAAGGITQADYWRLTADMQANQLPIASNLARVNTYGFDNNAKIGSGMTQSSGIFTFPATGLYWVHGFCNVYSANHSQTNTLQIRYTADGGSNWATASVGGQGIYDQGINSFGRISVDALIDVTSTSNIKVAFNFGAGQGGEYIQGHSTYTYTGFIFIRLGNT